MGGNRWRSMYDATIRIRFLILTSTPLWCGSCAHGTKLSDNMLVLRGRVEISEIEKNGKPLQGRFELALADDGRFRELIRLNGETRSHEILSDGRQVWARSFLAYPRTPTIEVNEAEADMWQEAMGVIREAAEPKVAGILKQVPATDDHSPVARGAKPEKTATAILTIEINDVGTYEGCPFPARWSRSLGGTRNIPYRTRQPGRSTAQVLLFQVESVAREVASTETFEANWHE